MSRFEIVLAILISGAAVCLMVALLLMARQAHAHEPILSNSIVIFPDPYAGRTDPVTASGCCGGQDCDVLKVEPGVLEGEGDGYRLRLTEAQARKINPNRKGPVDTYIPRERVQPTPPEWSGEYRVCIPNYKMETMRADFYCFWAPPNT